MIAYKLTSPIGFAEAVRTQHLEFVDAHHVLTVWGRSDSRAVAVILDVDTGALRAVADAIEAEVPVRVPRPLPGDESLDGVTAGVRSVLSILGGNSGGEGPSRAALGDAPAPTPS